jgi:hypothetical protein
MNLFDGSFTMRFLIKAALKNVLPALLASTTLLFCLESAQADVVVAEFSSIGEITLTLNGDGTVNANVTATLPIFAVGIIPLR